MKFIFGMQMNIKVFCKLLQSFWVCIDMPKVPKIRNSHISAMGGKVKYKSLLKDDSMTLGTQNKNLSISLQYLKKKVKDEVDFFPADKCQRFP